jgi:hypothetical protein
MTGTDPSAATGGAHGDDDDKAPSPQHALHPVERGGAAARLDALTVGRWFAYRSLPLVAASAVAGIEAATSLHSRTSGMQRPVSPSAVWLLSRRVRLF